MSFDKASGLEERVSRAPNMNVAMALIIGWLIGLGSIKGSVTYCE